MYKTLAYLVVFVASLCSTAEAAESRWEKTELGETAIFPMANAPFPHESRKDGYTTKDGTVYPRDPHYVDNSVAVFIPAGFRKGPKTDVVLFFHGHRHNIAKSFEQYRLREQFVAAGKNAILVFPEGPKDAADSGCGRLEEPGALRNLLTEVMETLVAEGKVDSPAIGRVLLTGHSGAYRVNSFCIKHGGMAEHVTDVCLLDSSYQLLDPFIDWVASRKETRLFSIFTDHLAPENVHMMIEMRRKKVDYGLLADEDVTAEDLAKNRVLFVYTAKRTHDETVQYLERWLGATTLPKR
ncbi:MAG: hypothetical protein JXA69_04725 [Phycisphaerae bacterium]|nr:hypothetical protein [Phycisphaerae bacterium]